MKMSIFIESKSGEPLAQSLMQKERFTIGRSANCDIHLDDPRIPDVEMEVYSHNDQCWLQMSKEAGSVTYKGKQYRSLSFNESSNFLFRDYVLKVIVEKEMTGEFEATRIVKGSIDEATKIVDSSKEEHTRLVKPTHDESTRIVSFSDAKTVMEAPQQNKKVQNTKKIDENFDDKILENYQLQSSHWLVEKILENKEKKIEIALYVSIGIVVSLLIRAIWGGSSQESLTKVVDERSSQLASLKSSDRDQKPVDEKNVTAVSREDYIRELSSLFDKH